MRTSRTVVGVARTVQSATRLLDTVSLFRADRRVQAVFAVDDSSAFSRGVSQVLLDAGCLVRPWAELEAADLVVAASENVTTPFHAPMIVVPHGVGFHKYVPVANGAGTRISGLVPERVLAERHVLMTVSHERQAAQLAAVSPATVGRTAVVGDLTLDQLIASQALRSRYRQALGLAAGQRLVVITSTWGDQSQFGQAAELAERLLAELPCDEFRVAQILHPNVWAEHSALQIRSWLADALDAGLLLIPPATGWQATLASADAVICDHGSLSLYAAALGIPLVLASFDAHIVPDTALAALVRHAIRLDLGRPVADQFALAGAPEQLARLTEVSDSAFSRRGQAAVGLRDVMYELMGLAPPSTAPRTRAAPIPAPEHRPVRAHVAHATVTGGSESRRVSLSRYPAALDAAGPAASAASLRHVVADVDGPDRWLVTNAAAVACSDAVAVPDALTWVGWALHAFPATSVTVATVDEGFVAATHDGSRVRIVPPTATRNGGGPDAAQVASALYALGRCRLLADGPVLLEVGARAWRLAVRRLG